MQHQTEGSKSPPTFPSTTRISVPQQIGIQPEASTITICCSCSITLRGRASSTASISTTTYSMGRWERFNCPYLFRRRRADKHLHLQQRIQLTQDSQPDLATLCLNQPAKLASRYSFSTTPLSVKGPGESPDGCVAMQGHITFVNNAVTACNPLVLIQNGTYGTGAPTIVQINYNTYGQSGSTPWVGTSGGESSLAGWRSYTGGETNSTLNTGGLNLASNGSPNSGSPVLGAGTNRTSSCSATTEPLCSSTSDGIY